MSFFSGQGIISASQSLQFIRSFARSKVRSEVFENLAGAGFEPKGSRPRAIASSLDFLRNLGLDWGTKMRYIWLLFCLKHATDSMLFWCLPCWVEFFHLGKNNKYDVSCVVLCWICDQTSRLVFACLLLFDWVIGLSFCHLIGRDTLVSWELVCLVH